MSTDVSEVRAAFITRALMMEAARTSETSIDIQLRTQQYIAEDSEPQNNKCFEPLQKKAYDVWIFYYINSGF
jgi:hypothetical protein